jgi:hypothetical protein
MSDIVSMLATREQRSNERLRMRPDPGGRSVTSDRRASETSSLSDA